jgi:PBP1b-binding outer membrane lipoprotein LpoB
LFRFRLSPKMGNQSITMKKIICILATAALFGACEQRTEVAPAAPAADKKDTTIINPPANTEKTKEKTTTNTITNAPPADGAVQTKSETKTETSSSPNP